MWLLRAGAHALNSVSLPDRGRRLHRIAALAVLTVGALLLSAAGPSDLPDFKVQWENDLAMPVVDAVVADDFIFVATADQIIALDAGGQKRWSLDLPAAQSLAAGDGQLWVAAAGKISRLNSRTGANRATADTGAEHVILAPTPVAGALLAEADGASLVIDASTLKIVHKHPEPLFHDRARFLRQSGYWLSRVDPDGRRVFFQSDSTVTSVGLPGGEVLFERNVDHRLYGWPTYHDDRVIVVRVNGLLGLNAANGKGKWKRSVKLSKPPDPLLITRRHPPHPWYKRLWTWGFNQTRGGSRGFLTLRYRHGISFRSAENGRGRVDHPMPDDPMPLYEDANAIFWLFRYTDEADGEAKTALMCMNKFGNQLFGRSPQPGTATGLFLFGDKRVYLEARPGVIVNFDQTELIPRAQIDLGAPLVTLGSVDGRVIGVSETGRVAAIRLH
jgi:PQQ-like domain